MKTKQAIISVLVMIFLTMNVIGADKLSQTLVEAWDGFDWANQSKMVYEYPADNQQVVTHYVDLGGEWEPAQRITTTFDDHGNPAAMLMEMYMQGTWMTISDITMVNTYNNDLLEKVESTTNMFLKTRDLYTYKDGKLVERLGQMDLGSGWEDSDRNKYYYSGGNLDYMTMEEYYESSWNFLSKSEYTYSGNRYDYIETFEWNETDWEKSVICYYSYNNDGTVSMEHQKFWDGVAYGEGEKYYHTYGGTPVISDNRTLLKSFELHNYPNPFNPSTTINYQLPMNSDVNLTVFNLQGQSVKVLTNGIQFAGIHEVIWDGTDKKGATVPSGVYVYRLTADNSVISKQCILLK